MIERIQQFLALLGGGNAAVLAKVPTERPRFVQMALVLLTTASLAVVSMTFALHDAVHAPWAWAVILGAFWGGVILNIDRFLVMSMGSTRDRRVLIWMALPRFGMAMLLALVISTPLVLRIFARDINAQLYIIRQENSKEQKTLLAGSEQQHQASQIERQINIDLRTLAGHLPIGVTNPQVSADMGRVSALVGTQKSEQTAVIRAREAWQCELYGSGPHCAGASNRPGPGPIAAAKHQQYELDLSSLRSTDRQLAQAQAQLAADQKAVRTSQKSVLRADQRAARKQLPGLEKSYATLEKYLKGQAAYGRMVNNGDTGLLAQIRALFDAGNGDWTLQLAHLAVFLLFFMIEILPVTVKLLLNFGALSTYEEVAKLDEDEFIDKARTERNQTRRIDEGKSRVRIILEDDMRSREETLGKKANEHVATEMEAILDDALQEWSQKVRQRLSQAGPGGTAPPPGAGGSAAGGPAGSPAPNASGGSGSRNGQGKPAGKPSVRVMVKRLFQLPDSGNL